MDLENKSPLPFASVSLMKHLTGTTTNDDGQFEFYYPLDSISDTLVISYLGYKQKHLDIRSVKDSIRIYLEPSSVGLSEVVIRPLPPTYYISMAMSRLKENYPDKPFQSEAYYREVFMENENFIKSDEGIFKTYFPNFLDTVQNQHQLLLYRRANDLSEIAFMSKKSKRKQSSQKKQDGDKPKDEKIEFKGIFGGPKTVLNIAKIKDNNNKYFDSNNFENYEFSFGKSSSYDDQELVIIDFKSIGKVDHALLSGCVYINVNSFAIVRKEVFVELQLSMVQKVAISLLAGVHIDHPKANQVTEFQNYSGKWYPKKVFFNIDLNVSKNHWFSPDEHSAFIIEEIFMTNKIQTEGVSPIAGLSRYDSAKRMEDQVHNDESISWDQINIIRQ